MVDQTDRTRKRLASEALAQLHENTKDVKNPSERMEVRKALLNLHAGRRDRARGALRSANKRRGEVDKQIAPGSSGAEWRSERELVESIVNPRWLWLPSFPGQLRVSRWFVVTILGLLGVVAAALIFRLAFLDVANAEESVSLLALTPLPLAAWTGAFLVAYNNRLTSVKMGDNALELMPTNPADDLIHVDLDFSANRILIISGLSHHRPEVPFHDVEPRFLPPPV